MWLILALLSAVFAAATSILAKIGIKGVNSNLATTIRTSVVLIMAWSIVFITKSQHGIVNIDRKSWLFLHCPDLRQEHLGYAISRLFK